MAGTVIYNPTNEENSLDYVFSLIDRQQEKETEERIIPSRCVLFLFE